MADPPSDGLGDGTQSEAFTIMTDITGLSEEQASDYRRELLHAYYHPGLEFDMEGAQGKIDSEAYLAQIRKVDVYLATFS